jgi:hypothetical protein
LNSSQSFLDFDAGHGKMNDGLIRESFHRQMLQRYHDAADTLVLNELGLRHGKCRADIAIVNGRLIGYEIKSDEDSLKRLDEQVQIYSAVFDRASVITGTKHLDAVLSRLPKWWGIVLCKLRRDGGVRFEILRRGEWNVRIDPIAIAQLLWKAEAGEILESLGEPPNLLRECRSVLYERLAAAIDLAQLQRRVRECLRQRRDWRYPKPLSLGGG